MTDMTEITNPNDLDVTVIDETDETFDTLEEDEDHTPTGADTPKVKYLTNKEFLAEIHKSKISYCVYLDPKYAAYDCIVARLDEITPELIESTRIRKAHLMTQAAKAILRAEGAKQNELKEAVVDPQTIPVDTIVFRVMTSEHIPLDPGRKRKGKGENSNHTRTPFLPFKHYVLDTSKHTIESAMMMLALGSNLPFKEVLRSHWRGDFETGVFDMTRGKMTNRLAEMFMLLVERYGRRSNWRAYTYLDEMKSHALLQLSHVGLQFNEAVGDNPFAFYTTTIKNSFTRILNLEKKNQNIRDDILIMHGANPSYTRQNDEDHERALAREARSVSSDSED